MEIVLVLSILVNVVFITYSVICARRLFTVASNISDLQDQVSLFRAHVETLHDTEMYYGDESLQNLIEHTKDLIKEFDKYEDIFTIVLDADEGAAENFDEDNQEKAPT